MDFIRDNGSAIIKTVTAAAIGGLTWTAVTLWNEGTAAVKRRADEVVPSAGRYIGEHFANELFSLPCKYRRSACICCLHHYQSCYRCACVWTAAWLYANNRYTHIRMDARNDVQIDKWV